MTEVTKEFLNEIFYFENRYLRWKINRSSNAKAGDRAGTSEPNFYISVVFFGNRDRAHRIVWVMNNGAIPEGYIIDHIDNDPSNNDIGNLRLATTLQSSFNKRKNGLINKSGYKGVFYVPHAKKWRAQVQANGKCKSLGYFNTPKEGHEAYKKAAQQLHGEFANY